MPKDRARGSCQKIMPEDRAKEEGYCQRGLFRRGSMVIKEEPWKKFLMILEFEVCETIQLTKWLYFQRQDYAQDQDHTRDHAWYAQDCAQRLLRRKHVLWHLSRSQKSFNQEIFVNGHFRANNSAKVEENDYDTIDSAIEDLTLKIHMTK